MAFKVVYNTSICGFSLSHKAAKKLAELGDKDAQDFLKREVIDKEISSYYGRNLVRHDSRLIQVVEELGEEANGYCSKLRVATVNGDKYRIITDSYVEEIETPESIKWVEVNE